ncbi:dihydroxyacetone kinase subunit DhaL [Providencia sneebia]|uniref:Dihydroxyacetone kinase subunit L n=1 Tax=Providencia sneebia DSM 19967 TaxID=1141660 RepID=K8WHA8_9GAMM|nr:dihydroxyacetone kinase subunit DhaL [Providencia sneebia]EKT59914.1 dihydroxyacetone kinase subunit L [Providencia sneebia DSM 19967]
MNLTQKQLYNWLIQCSQTFAREQDKLTELDTAIGDGDHGLNMNRGFQKVAEKLPSVEDKDIATLLKTTGMTLLSSVGGASGPLFGTFFIKAAQNAANKESLSVADLAELIKAGTDGVVSRGKAEPNDKTMCDVWWPVSEALENNASLPLNDAIAIAVDAAKQGVESTIPMQARKGRASYLGERSIGHADPGGMSVFLMLETLQKAI